MEQKQETLLEIHDLSVSFRMYDAGLEQKDLQVISDLHLRIRPGEIVAVAGSSGSGKSLLASAILGILPANATVRGHVHYRGKELTPEMQRELRGKEIALVPQSVAYLDPLMRVGKQVDGHRRPKPTEKRRSLFRRLELPERTETLYPFQLSGGMARRVLVSTALLTEASLVIADEPTPGMSLDQALEALRMFREMADAGKSVLLITHDIDLAFEFADRVAVFYAGTTVEIAPVEDFAPAPRRSAIPTAKPSGGPCPRTALRPSTASSPTPEACPGAASSPPGAPMPPTGAGPRSRPSARSGAEK